MVNWWRPIDEFPSLVLYKTNKWEFVIYDEDDSKESDYICIFSEVKSYDPNFFATTYTDISYMIEAANKGCECGSAHGGGHMFFCPKWSKF